MYIQHLELLDLKRKKRTEEKVRKKMTKELEVPAIKEDQDADTDTYTDSNTVEALAVIDSDSDTDEKPCNTAGTSEMHCKTSHKLQDMSFLWRQ